MKCNLMLGTQPPVFSLNKRRDLSVVVSLLWRSPMELVALFLYSIHMLCTFIT